ncbi:hypothetical protein JRQ81_007693 [Phrynocephalus forsythii]|uniref:Ig-like domain-containing protein n=1 Tax=Phrynocephalus forsythii TaxID=171643 RepID=A0A9Q1ASZ3_9SAUR|nr:hypothetical protein JRQ81_007693 [Phrynocephalus forsythii]
MKEIITVLCGLTAGDTTVQCNGELKQKYFESEKERLRNQAASNTDASLTQPSATSATLGNPTRLSCTLSTDSITRYTILWFQHKYPSPPRYLLYYKDDSTQGKRAGVSERFSASKDTSASTCYLTISSVQSEDEGAYFCVTSKGGE